MRKNIFMIGFLCFIVQVVACGQEKKPVIDQVQIPKAIENTDSLVNLNRLSDDDIKILQIKKSQNRFKIRTDSIYDKLSINEAPLFVYNRYVDIVSPKDNKIIKTIDIQSFNPYNDIQRFEPIYNQLIGKVRLKEKNKESIRSFLPETQYAKIPDADEQDWAEIFSGVKVANNNYVIATFAFEWFGVDDRDEFSRGEFSTTTIVVWDTLGREIFKSKFDGAFPYSEISIDGKYLLLNGGKYYGGYSPFNLIKLININSLQEIPLKLIPEKRSIIISYSPLTTYLVLHSEFLENAPITNFLIIDSKKEKLYVYKNTGLIQSIKKINNENMTKYSPKT